MKDNAAGQGSSACNTKASVNANQNSTATQAVDITDTPSTSDTDANDQNSNSNTNLLQRAFPSIKPNTAKEDAKQLTETTPATNLTTGSSPSSSTTEVSPANTAILSCVAIPLPTIVASTDLKTTAPAPTVALRTILDGNFRQHRSGSQQRNSCRSRATIARTRARECSGSSHHGAARQT